MKSVFCCTLNVLLGSIFTVLLTPEQENFNLWKVLGGILVIVSGFLLYAKKEGKITCGGKPATANVVKVAAEKPLLLEVQDEDDEDSD